MTTAALGNYQNKTEDLQQQFFPLTLTLTLFNEADNPILNLETSMFSVVSEHDL